MMLLLTGNFELNPGPLCLTKVALQLVGQPLELDEALPLRVGKTPVPSMLPPLLAGLTILATWPSPLQPLLPEPPPLVIGPQPLLSRPHPLLARYHTVN